MKRRKPLTVALALCAVVMGVIIDRDTNRDETATQILATVKVSF